MEKQKIRDFETVTHNREKSPHIIQREQSILENAEETWLKNKMKAVNKQQMVSPIDVTNIGVHCVPNWITRIP